MKVKRIAHPILEFLASHGLICGFLAQFSSKPGSGLPFIVVYFGIITIKNIAGLAAFISGISYLSLSPEIELDSCRDFSISVLRSFGSLLSLIALLSISDGKMSMIWSGLIGSCVIYVGELLNLLKVFRMHRSNG